MLSQNPNPPWVSYSLQQQMGNVEPNNKPFSIRQYVLATRHNDIFHSWPFPVKYLQICLKHGIKNVLPPLEPLNSNFLGSNCCQEDKESVVSFDDEVAVGKLEMNADDSGLNFDEVTSEISTKDGYTSIFVNKPKANNHLRSSIISDYMVPVLNQSLTTMPSYNQHVYQSVNSPGRPKRLRHKRKSRKGKCKKRSLVDILSVAKKCTLEDLNMIGRLSCGSIKSTVNGYEGS